MRLVFLQQRDSNMVRALTCFTIASLWLTGLAVSDKVHQSPSELMKGSGGSMTLNCSHTIPSYDNLLWYHWAAGDSALTLIGYVYYEQPNVEISYKKHVNLSGNGRVAASLHIPKVRSADSGVYFCAASRHSVYRSSICTTKTESTLSDALPHQFIKSRAVHLH
ncbi:hypothetical protein AAFF_G00386920 [Aldrovandia affinis]|uniref:Ig-like domain-containing protein n=1 Tax=Aldrovandia affinis TaxID=143900 RepID=A0AAD7SEP0_9TELE|nr:hypothetical protein AAFF_G00386920 [Aldrovandia affinis]